jgi:hypothetical protein
MRASAVRAEVDLYSPLSDRYRVAFNQTAAADYLLVHFFRCCVDTPRAGLQDEFKCGTGVCDIAEEGLESRFHFAAAGLGTSSSVACNCRMS